MAQPLPSSITGLQDAVMRRVNSLDRYLVELLNEHSFEAYAQRYGCTTPRYDAEGKLIEGSIDAENMTDEQREQCLHQSDPYTNAVGHIGKSMAIRIPRIFADQSASSLDKAEDCLANFNAWLDELNTSGDPIVQKNLQPLRVVVTECKSLCEAFLEKQQAAGKGSGFGRLGS